MSGKRPEAGTISGDFGALLQSAEWADVTLVAGGCQLPAHSLVLATRSPVFAAMMRHDMQETRTRRIEIPDVREEVLRQLLSFVYSDETPQLADVAGELLVAADKYDLPVLKSRCAQQLQRDLSVENAATTAALAVRHCCPELQSTAISFVVHHHPEVMATDSWAQMLREDVEIGVEICRQLATELQSSDSSNLTEENGKRLIEAAKKGAAEEVQRLLAAGATVEARDEEKLTPLHWASAKGHMEVVRCLLSAGAVVDSRSIKQSTPLHWASAEGHTAVVCLLVASGAYHSSRNQPGFTPLHYAAQNGHVDTTAALLELGAHKEARTDVGSTPLDLAMNNYRQQVIDMLR